MIELETTGDGVRLRLRVRPSARRREIVGEHGGALKLSVTAAPERGKANREVVDLLAETLGVAASALEIVRGEHGSDKVVVVRGLALDEVRRRLA